MLTLLQTFDAVILLGPVCCHDSPQTAQAMCEQVRQRNSATFRLLGEQDSFDAMFHQWERSLRATSTGSVGGSGGSSRGASDDRAKAVAGADYVQSTTVLYRAALQTTLDRDVVRAIQNMDSLTSMRVLGDKLMRDRLSAMTVAFFKYVNRMCGRQPSVRCVFCWVPVVGSSNLSLSALPHPLSHTLSLFSSFHQARRCWHFAGSGRNALCGTGASADRCGAATHGRAQGGCAAGHQQVRRRRRSTRRVRVWCTCV